MEMNKFLTVFANMSRFERDVIFSLVDGYESYGEKLALLMDVVEHGCSSGIASAYIYTADNTKFLKDHLEDVFEVLDEINYTDWMGRENMLDANYMVWCTVEEIANRFLNEYERLGDEE